MADTQEQINGTQRAAILLLSLGEKDAAAVLKHMAPTEAEKLGVAMSGLAQIRKDQLEDVFATLDTTLEDHAGISAGGEAYIRNVLTNAFGEAKANTLLDRIFAGADSKSLEALAWMETKAIVEMVRNEHPQIIAIVLAYLDAERAAEVLSLLPEGICGDVVFRIAKLDDVQQSALKELEAMVDKQSAGSAAAKSEKIGGEKVAAGILNALGTSQEEAVVEHINQKDETLVARIQELMFIFDNLLAVSDRGIQSLLREISGDTLAMAVKGADPAMQDKIYRNMSKRAAQMLQEDLEAKGPVRLSDVEAAQREILVVAKRMADAGDIVISTGAGDDYV
ncbi:MAG: flagellar motor switch protein FliG [Gammaproteobacteria bacterium]|nr:flagellar motor switch protein FliG [Gammaproteobacteria bacterium]